MQLAVLNFLRNPKKKLEMIKSVSIGEKSWIESSVALSEEFVADLIKALPNLKHIELYTASGSKNILKAISQSGRDFEHVNIFSSISPTSRP